MPFVYFSLVAVFQTIWEIDGREEESFFRNSSFIQKKTNIAFISRIQRVNTCFLYQIVNVISVKIKIETDICDNCSLVLKFSLNLIHVCELESTQDYTSW